MDLFFIKSFIAVAQTGSFRAAAQRNNITQPAVSQHIQLIEKKLRCSLLDRSSKKTTLTPAGQVFLVYAQQMLDAYQNACLEIERMTTLSTGSVRIASIYSIGLYQLKPTIQHFFEKYPNINIHLEYAHHNSIYGLIKDKLVDFGMVAFPKQTPGFTTKIFTRDALTLVQSPKHRLFKKNTKIPLKRLNKAPFISIDPTSPTGLAIHQFLKTHQVTVEIVKEYENIETVKNAVAAGLGCSILPEITIAKELKESILETIPTPELNIQRPLAIVHSDKKVFNKASEMFLKFISETSIRKT